MVQDYTSSEQVDYTTEQKLPAITVNTSPRLEEAPDFEHTFSQFTPGQQTNFETPLSSEDETKFQAWKQEHAPKDSGFDYDLRGAFKDGLTPQASDGHWPDTYKKPWHETFSDESIYAKDAPGLAGKWTGPNHDVYEPGPDHPKLEEVPAEKHTELEAAHPNRDDMVDANQSKLAEVIHDLRVKFMGDPEKWSTKEEVGNFINQAMSVMGGGYKGPPKGLNPPFKVTTVETPYGPLFSTKNKPPVANNQNISDRVARTMAAQIIDESLGNTPRVSNEEAIALMDKYQPLFKTGKVFEHTQALRKEVAALDYSKMDKYERAAFDQGQKGSTPEKAARRSLFKIFSSEKGLTTETIPQQQQAQHMGPVPPKTMVTPLQEQLVKYETLSSQGKTTKQIVKATKMDPETVRDNLGRDNLAIAAFNSENALTSAYFKSLQNLDPALGQAIKNAVSVKDLKRYTRNLPEAQLKTIFEELPPSVKESFMSGEARREAIDAGKKTKIIARPDKEPRPLSEAEIAHVNEAVRDATKSSGNDVNVLKPEGTVKAGWDANRKTPTEIAGEEFATKQGASLSDEGRLSLIKQRIKQIEYDRRLSTKVTGEQYPPNGELLQLRSRLKHLQEQPGAGDYTTMYKNLAAQMKVNDLVHMTAEELKVALKKPEFQEAFKTVQGLKLRRLFNLD